MSCSVRSKVSEFRYSVTPFFALPSLLLSFVQINSLGHLGRHYDENL